MFLSHDRPNNADSAITDPWLEQSGHGLQRLVAEVFLENHRLTAGQQLVMCSGLR